MRLRFRVFFQIFLQVSLESPVHGHLCNVYDRIFCLLFHEMFSKLNIKVYFLSPFCILQTKISLRRQFKLYLLYVFFFFLGVCARVCLVTLTCNRIFEYQKKFMIWSNDLVFERGCQMSNLKREKQNLKSSLVLHLESLLKHLQLYTEY